MSVIEEDLEVAGHVCPGVLVLAAILVWCWWSRYVDVEMQTAESS